MPTNVAVRFFFHVKFHLDWDLPYRAKIFISFIQHTFFYFTTQLFSYLITHLTRRCIQMAQPAENENPHFDNASLCLIEIS